jgi:hypothetical protein
MNQELLSHSQHIYIPAVAIDCATLKHSWNRLPVATIDSPEHICGEARRIGYTGTTTTDLALYRLKVRAADHIPTMTLPGIYIIEGGQFFDYEQWKRQRERQS